jgi:hypothetical protein
MRSNALVIDPTDNVATVLEELAPGAEVVAHDGSCHVVAGATIPTGHKVALSAIDTGEAIVKYGHVIGVASRPIAAGEHVHTHNLTGQEL